MAEIYISSYCNFPHRIRDGKPIEHECDIIPPKALEAEMAGDYVLAIELMDAGKTHRRFGERCLPHMTRGVMIIRGEGGKDDPQAGNRSRNP